MSDDLHANLRALPAPLRQQVDAVCDRFETAWQTAGAAGDRPRIEDYLGSGAALEGPALVQQLVLVDIEQRRGRGESPQPVDYQQRFPDLDPHWLLQALAPPADPTATAPVAPGPAKAPVAPASAEGQRLRCPHCHNPIQLQDDRPDEVLCPACGSSFQVRDARQTTTATGMRPLGKFQLLQRVGVGAFGAVWKARDPELDRIVALKIPHAGLLTEQEELERFHREARAAAQLRHPGIVTVHEVQVLEGLPTIVADFVEGAPLKDLLQTRPLTFRESATLIADVAEALNYAHGKGLVHRDIKPANIMLDYSQRPRTSDRSAVKAAPGIEQGIGRPLVMDFGLALRSEAEVTLTLDGQIIGTPAYMSPEQAAGQGHRVDGRSDVYSLGVILYELLGGALPFRGSRAMLLVQVLHEEPRPLRQLNDKIPRDLETICHKALAKEPSRRYATAQELTDDLRRWLSGEPIRARPVSQVERLARWCRRNPVVAGLVAAVILVTAVGFGAALWQMRLALANEQTAKTNEAEALKQQGIAEDQAKLARRLLYASDLNVALQAWETGNLVWARELLERQRPQQGAEDLRGFEWRYLWRLCRDGSRRTFRGHTKGITATTFSPDGKMLASESFDGSVRLWDVATQRALVTLGGHEEGRDTSVAFSPNGEILVTASAGGPVNLWEVASWRRVTTLPHVGSYQVAFSPDGQLLASNGKGGIKLWDVKTRQEVATVSGRTGSAWAFSPDGRILAVNDDAEVRLWDLATQRDLALPLQGHTATVLTLAFSPDSKVLASAANDAKVLLWDLATKQLLSTLRGHTSPVSSIAFSPDGKTLATGSGDSTVKLWDTATQREVRILQGHTGRVSTVAFSPTGTTLVTGSWDGTVKLWDLAPQGNPNLLPGHEAWVHAMAFSPDGKTLASAGWYDKLVKLWDPASGRQVGTLEGHQGAVTAVTFSPDSQTLVSASSHDQTIRFWNLATQREEGIFTDTGVGAFLGFSPDGKTLAADRSNNTVQLWDLATRRQRTPLSGQKFAFAPDGKTLAGSCPDGTARLWDLSTQQVIATFEGQATFQAQGPAAGRGNRAIYALTFSPDGRTFATASADLTIYMWDVGTQRQIACLRGHTDQIWVVAFPPDGKSLATCSRDGTIKLWNLTVQAEAATLKGHRGQVFTMAFAPDGNLLATAGSDGTIRLWPAAPFSETDAP